MENLVIVWKGLVKIVGAVYTIVVWLIAIVAIVWVSYFVWQAFSKPSTSNETRTHVNGIRIGQQVRRFIRH